MATPREVKELLLNKIVELVSDIKASSLTDKSEKKIDYALKLSETLKNIP